MRWGKEFGAQFASGVASLRKGPLGVTRQALNNLVNGKSGISPEMAIRLSKAFGGSSAVWLKMQMDYDLAQAEKGADRIKVRRVLHLA